MKLLGGVLGGRQSLQTLPLPWDSGSDIYLGPVVQILQGSVPGFPHRSSPHRHPEKNYLGINVFTRWNPYSLYHSSESKDYGTATHLIFCEASSMFVPIVWVCVCVCMRTWSVWMWESVRVYRCVQYEYMVCTCVWCFSMIVPKSL